MDANAGAAKAARVALALHATAAAKSNGFKWMVQDLLKVYLVQSLK